MNKKISVGNWKCFTALVLALLVTGACTKGAKNTPVSEGTRDGILHYGNGTEPSDLDPSIVTGVPESHIVDALFEGLVDFDSELRPIPAAAESWSVSDDKRIYTFKIRKDAKWSNGDAVRAQDFVYAWNRILSPGLGSEYAYMLHTVKNAKAFNEGKIKDFDDVGAKAPDAQTFQVTLENPVSYFLSALVHHSTFPVHKATVEKFGKMDTRGTQWTRAGNLVGNGAFVLKQWELNKIIVVTKNPRYWDAANIKINEVRFYPTEAIQTEERMFRSGQLHLTNTIPLNKIEVYRKENPEQLRIEPYLGTYFYRINVTRPTLNNKLVRRALSLALDRKAIVERVTKGNELPAYTFTPPNTAGYTARAQVPFDPELAKKTLAEAGFPGGKGLPKISILYNTSESHKLIAQAVQEMWKKYLGIEVELVNQEWKVYLDTEKNLNFDISRAGWIGDYGDPNTFLDMFLTNGGNNRTGWSSKEYDSLIAQAGAEMNQSKRFELFQKAETILIDESPVIPVYTYTTKHLLSRDVKGWDFNILDYHPLKRLYLEASEGTQVSQK